MKGLRTRLTVACSFAVTAGLILVGAALQSNANPVASASQLPPASATSIAGSQTPAESSDNDESEAGPRPAPLVVASAPASFGSKLVDGAGMTLYVFSRDTAGTSKCMGSCAREWLPMRSAGGKPQPGSGATNPNIGSIQRPDGSNQITFNGHPVYYYSGDTGPGQTTGQGRNAFGGQWSASPPTKP